MKRFIFPKKAFNTAGAPGKNTYVGSINIYKGCGLNFCTDREWIYILGPNVYITYQEQHSKGAQKMVDEMTLHCLYDEKSDPEMFV